MEPSYLGQRGLYKLLLRKNRELGRVDMHGAYYSLIGKMSSAYAAVSGLIVANEFLREDTPDELNIMLAAITGLAAVATGISHLRNKRTASSAKRTLDREVEKITQALFPQQKVR